MREIKFRGKRVDNGAWVYGYIIERCICPFTIGSEYLIKKGYNGEEFTVNDYTVGQFTGLLDKNGKEIYEGDLLKHSAFTKPLTVKYQYSNFSPFDESCEYGCLGIHCEVIGNIHDEATS
jgi:uncharacterized phage protein (TIGR01671 family)